MSDTVIAIYSEAVKAQKKESKLELDSKYKAKGLHGDYSVYLLPGGASMLEGGAVEALELARWAREMKGSVPSVLATCSSGKEEDFQAVVVQIERTALQKAGFGTQVWLAPHWIRRMSWSQDTLPNSPSGGYRTVGKVVGNFANSYVFWPPALAPATVHKQASLAWEVQLTEEEAASQDTVNVAAEKIGGDVEAIALFRRFYKNGDPSSIWMIRALGVNPTHAKDFLWEGKRHAKLVQRCAWCLRGPPFADYHDHLTCPQVTMVSKLRENEGFEQLGKADGVIVTEDVKKPDDLKGEVAALTKRVVELEKEVKKLKGAGGSKRKPDDDDDKKGGPSKKAKKDEKKKDAPKAKKGKAEGKKKAKE